MVFVLVAKKHEGVLRLCAVRRRKVARDVCPARVGFVDVGSKPERGLDPGDLHVLDAMYGLRLDERDYTTQTCNDTQHETAPALFGTSRLPTITFPIARVLMFEGRLPPLHAREGFRKRGGPTASSSGSHGVVSLCVAHDERALGPRKCHLTL
ncbi:hypothetical protein FIBSPDRAFT_947820 [Athelia psychrophila]|uniref:Uncharacterized protein n=1 Tax=Athelia psychrophila TaxID=1759441 RepID=A0A166RG58_9AGAM|nr:hypothetical protein FIBSPDRAFT_947820 [Fibularhizoctonia sp. CBS 109695]